MYDANGQNIAIQFPSPSPINDGARPWLDNLDKPWWLRNDLHDNEWRVTDKSPAEAMRINWEYPLYDTLTQKVSLLTAPENAGLLEVAQLFCYYLRNSQISHIESHRTQVHYTRSLLVLFAWMRLNFVYSVCQLAPSHFKLFMEALPWGCVRLLELDRRFDDYVCSLKAAGRKMPLRLDKKTKGHRKNYYSIDVDKVYHQIGVDPNMRTHWGKNFTYKFWRTVVDLNGEEFVEKDQRETVKELEEPERTPIRAKTAAQYVRTWQFLHDISHLLPQKCKVNPSRDFRHGEDLSSKKISKEALRLANIEDDEGITETIPDAQGFHLIDHAIRWVLNYSDSLFELRYLARNEIDDNLSGNKFSDKKKAKEKRRVYRWKRLLKNVKPKFKVSDPGAPWPLNATVQKGENGNQNLSIEEATGRYLMAASAIVIATFTARRKMEILTIMGGEPSDEDTRPPAIYIDPDGEPWLWCWIEKTYQKWDRIPIPNVVVKAVEVLEALTAKTREARGSRNLFELESLTGADTNKFNFLVSINLFADYVQVPPLKDGSKWVFKPHQFRRFFALLYMYRYNYGEHGKFEALSWHLRHLNMEMTKRYIEEIHNTDMLKAHSKHIVVDLMSQVLREERKAAGPGGEAMKAQLNEMVHEVIKNSEILSGKENPVIAKKIAERVMQKLDIEMIPFMWGYCYAHKDIENGKFHGKCIKDGVEATLPDTSRATPKRCFGCKHLYVDEHFRAYWEAGAKANKRLIDCDKMSAPMNHMAKQNLVVFETGLEQYFGDWPEWGS